MKTIITIEPNDATNAKAVTDLVRGIKRCVRHAGRVELRTKNGECTPMSITMLTLTKHEAESQLRDFIATATSLATDQSNQHSHTEL